MSEERGSSSGSNDKNPERLWCSSCYATSRGNDHVDRDTFEIISFKILMYLNENREAKDPLAHVVDYWLKQRDREYLAVRVEEVLQALVAKGVITKVEQGRKQTYKINPGESTKISALLGLLKPE
jgi:hypothetical protein